MNFPLYIAKRYFLSFSKNSSINIITGIASLGIIASSMALLIVLSVFSGLRDFSLSFTNASDPDIKMLPKSGKTILITTHIMSFVNEVADEIVFLLDGKIYFKGTVDELKKQTNNDNLEHAIANLIAKQYA